MLNLFDVDIIVLNLFDVDIIVVFLYTSLIGGHSSVVERWLRVREVPRSRWRLAAGRSVFRKCLTELGCLQSSCIK